MIVRSEEKNVLDVGAIPTTSTKQEPFTTLKCNLFYTESEWGRAIGWGTVPDYRAMGVTSFDRAKSIQADDSKGD